MRDPFVILNFGSHVQPKPVENKSKDWVLNGRNNEFYQYIIDRNNGSPTNAAIIQGKVNLIYGKGLSIKATPNNTNERVKVKTILKPKDVRRVVEDFVKFNEFSVEGLENRGKDLLSIKHLPKNEIVPALENEDYEITRYWHSRDWAKNMRPENEPTEIPAFNGKKQPKWCYVAKPYQSGRKYFSTPSYLAGLQYAELEEEISNLFINSVKNNLSAGFIVNVQGGQNWEDEDRREFQKRIKEVLTGSQNAGTFIVSFNGQDVQVTVEPFPVNENAHKQWAYLTDVARQQIITAHRVTSPMLFGVKDNTGLGNNADELRQAYELYKEWVVKHDQDFITDAFEEMFAAYGINVDLSFIPLSEIQEEPAQVEMSLAGFDPNQKRDKSGRWTDGDDIESEAQTPTQEQDYRMQHQIGWDKGYHSTLDDLVSGDGSPPDLYENPSHYMWGQGNDYKESWSVIEESRGKPDSFVTIYRAVPNYVDTINPGDWVSLSYSYALRHSSDLMGEGKDGKIISQQVRVSDVIWDGNDINEFGFLPEKLQLSKQEVQYDIDAFLEAGEDEPGDGWEVIDESRCEKMTLTEEKLNTVIQLARVPRDDKNTDGSRSMQDTSLFKIRYKYAGAVPGQNSRDFCKKVFNSGKVFKAETLNKEQYITPKMGKGGSNTYNPFLYKGGVNCKHFWQRVVYLKSNNEQITVNQARKLILELDPSERDDARWEQNPPEVAQSASPFNNYWKAN